MEKRKTFHGRQVGKKRLLPIVFPLFLFLLIPLNGYGDDTPMPEVVQQNSTRITGVVKDAYGEWGQCKGCRNDTRNHYRF